MNTQGEILHNFEGNTSDALCEDKRFRKYKRSLKCRIPWLEGGISCVYEEILISTPNKTVKIKQIAQCLVNLKMDNKFFESVLIYDFKMTLLQAILLQFGLLEY